MTVSSLVTTINNTVIDIRLDTLQEVQREVDETTGNSFTKEQVTDLLQKVRKTFEDKRRKDRRSKNSAPTKRRQPTRYNAFVKMTIPKIRERFTEMKKNDLMRTCADIWKTLDKDVRDTFDVEKFTFEGKLLDNVNDASAPAVPVKPSGKVGGKAVAPKGKAVKA
jgi:site-specific DNA-adenine methylase